MYKKPVLVALGIAALLVVAGIFCQQTPPPPVDNGITIETGYDPTMAATSSAGPVSLGTEGSLTMPLPDLMTALVNSGYHTFFITGEVAKDCAEWKLIEVMRIVDANTGANVIPHTRGFKSGSPPVPDPADASAGGSFVNNHAGAGANEGPFVPGSGSGTPGNPLRVRQQVPDLHPGFHVVIDACLYCVAAPASPLFHKYAGCESIMFMPNNNPGIGPRRRYPSPEGDTKAALDKWAANHGAF